MGLFENLTDEDFNESSNVLPDGSYNLKVDKAEIKETKKGKKYIGIMFTVTGPKYIGKKYFENFWCFSDNIEYNNQVISRIGSIAVKNGYTVAQTKGLDLHDLIGMEVGANIKVQNSEKYGEQNQISNFKKLINEVAPPQGTTSKNYAPQTTGEAKGDEKTNDASPF